MALTFDPHLAVCKNFLFPNRHSALEFADGPLAGFECGVAMWGTDSDHHARLANFQPASAVHDADVGNIESLVSFAPESLEFALGHRRVGLINQKKRSSPAGPLTRVAVQRDRCTAFGQDNATGDGADVDRLSG